MRSPAILLVLLTACGAPPPPHRPVDPDDPARHGGVAATSEARLTGFDVLEGPLAIEDAQLALNPTRGQVQHCLDGTTLQVRGQLAVRLQLRADGTVERSEAENAEGLDPDVVFCVVRAVRSTAFPPRDAPSVVRVTLGFVER
jgi:hypothetical protein